MTIKAIETVYKGYKFRSRLEARWAVFFDALGLEWQYEVEGFDLDGIWYLPDFWIPLVECWVEIKPTPPNHTETEKASRLFELSQKPVFIIYGDFSTNNVPLRAKVFPVNQVEMGKNPLFALVTRLVILQTISNLTDLINRKQWIILSGVDETSIVEIFDNAFQVARQARFEKGCS